MDFLIECGKCGANNLVKALTTTAGGRTAPRPALIPEALNKITTLEQTEKLFEKLIKDFLESREKLILSELELIGHSDILSQIKSIELKDLNTELISKLKRIMSTDDLSILTTLLISKAFEQGLSKAGDELKMMFIPNKPAIEFIQTYVFSNIKDMTGEIAADLRGEFERGLMDQEGPKEIAKRIQKVFKVNESRAMAIARTETNRAFGHGTLEGYKQSGLEGDKEWVAHIDQRTSDICKRNNGQKVPLHDKFRDAKTGQEFMTNPFHVNCVVAGTKIATRDGEKNIEDVQIGDMVLTHTGKFKKVLETFVRDYEGDLVEIETDKGDVLHITPDHPILKKGTWISAKEARVGDIL